MEWITAKKVMVLLGLAVGLKFATTAPAAIETFSVGYQKTDVSMHALSTSTAEVAVDDAPPSPEEVQQCETPEEVLAILSEERSLIAEDRKRADQEVAEISLARDKLDVERKMLEELEGRVEDLIAEVEKSHTDDVDRLVSLYKSMKADEAASIINDLDVEVTVMVLGKMSTRVAGPILAKMSPVRARAISKIIYERSKLPGDQKLNGIRLD